MKNQYSIIQKLLFAVALLASVTSCSSLKPAGKGGASVDCGGPDDGRFTIGANGIRLMYGFPIPSSTSHFVVKVNGKYASNYGHLGSNVQYICTTKKMKVVGKKKFSEMEFEFEGIKILQRLVPVDNNLAEVDSSGAARYYRIEYEFYNKTLSQSSVGLLLLIDNMIADNDAPKLEGDGKRVTVETKFEGAQVPKQVFLYRTEGDLTDHTAEILTQQAEATKPDELAIGRWPYFHKVIWDFTPSGGAYSDAAVLMKWNPKEVGPLQKIKCATYYGMARKTDKAKKLLATEDIKIASVFSEKASTSLLTDTVYFDNANTTLSKKFTKAIDKLLEGRNPQNVLGAIVEGHTDAVGGEDSNVEYSRNRAKSVLEYLGKKGISANKVVPKGYGETYADQSSQAQKDGKAKDRKAVIIIYYKAQ
jgi:outer membrane protein OmpA-like peptidoglycan-associated protein